MKARRNAKRRPTAAGVLLDGDLTQAEVKERHRQSIEHELGGPGFTDPNLPPELEPLMAKVVSGGHLSDADVKTYHDVMKRRYRESIRPRGEGLTLA